MKRLILPFVWVFVLAAFALGLASRAGAVSPGGGVTYVLDCGSAGTVSAVVQFVSADDVFHVTSVTGGDGTVVAGDILVNTSYLLSNGGASTSLGSTTTTCRSSPAADRAPEPGRSSSLPRTTWLPDEARNGGRLPRVAALRFTSSL